MHWLWSNEQWLFSGIGGTLLVGLLGLVYRKFFHNRAASSQTLIPSNSMVANSGNATFTANPTINVYAPPHAAETSSPAGAVDPPTVSDSYPFIERLDIRFAKIHRTTDRRYKWIESEGGPTAVVIEFRNRPAQRGEQAGTAESVVARLIFTPKNAKRVVNNAACWLDETVQGATIEPGAVRKLVIIVYSPQENRNYTLFNPRVTLPIYFSRSLAGKERVQPIEALELSMLPCDVELTLVSENRTLYNESYELQGQGDVIQLVPKARKA